MKKEKFDFLQAAATRLDFNKLDDIIESWGGEGVGKGGENKLQAENSALTTLQVFFNKPRHTDSPP